MPPGKSRRQAVTKTIWRYGNGKLRSSSDSRKAIVMTQAAGDHANLRLLLARDLATVIYNMPATTIMAPFVVLFLVVIVSSGRANPLVLLVLASGLAIGGLLLGIRVRTLLRLCRTGVEVEAQLVNVDDDFGGETDFRIATYRYEYLGNSYHLRHSAADFFSSLATRHGKQVIVLLDPERPKTAVILRSLEESSDSLRGGY
jgi:Protein of unknown function (DUF3592)